MSIYRADYFMPCGDVTHIAPERYSDYPYGDGDEEDVVIDLAKKSDVYSYGVLLWEIRERQRPYEGYNSSTIRLLVERGVQLPEGHATGAPPFFDDLMKKSVQFDPQNRPTFRDIVVTHLAKVDDQFLSTSQRVEEGIAVVTPQSESLNILDHDSLTPLEPYDVKLGQEMDLQYNPSHLEMDAVAYAMGSQWRVVAQLIMPVLSEFEIQKIESEEQENQPLCFLQAWINKHGLKATRAALCSALFFADLGSGAREVFPEIYENMSKDALLEPDLQIERDELVYNEEEDSVGGGSRSEVFEATLKKRGIERQVAVKVFRDFRRRLGGAEKEYEQFKIEASIFLRIKPHDNVLRLIGLCNAPRHYALVTELVSGRSLYSLLKSPEHKETVDKWQTRIAFAKQIAEGMLHLHYNCPSVIHKNLTATNVLINIIPHRIFPFICKVANFGLSETAEAISMTTMDRESFPAGTVTHIAPERYRYRPYGDGDSPSKMDLARKADVYSYGVVLWEIREKRRPFEGMVSDMIRLHVKEGGELPRGVAVNVPPLFDNVLKQCVQFNPQKRPMFRDVVLTLMEYKELANRNKKLEELADEEKLNYKSVETMTKSVGGDVLSKSMTMAPKITSSDLNTSKELKAIREEIFGVARTFVKRDTHKEVVLPHSGGELRLKESDVQVTLPKGALAEETLITLSSYFPEEPSSSSAVMSITEVLPHGLTLRERSTIRIKHHICLDKPYRVRVLYQSGTNLHEPYRLIADLCPGYSSTIDSEREIKVTEDFVEISCCGFCRICLVKEGYFSLSVRVYSPIRLRQSKRESVCVTVSCQCRDVTKEIDEELRGQGMVLRNLFSAGFNVDILEKIHICLLEGDGYKIQGTNCHDIESGLLRNLIGEDHYKKESRHFHLQLATDAAVDIPFELRKFGKKTKDTGKIVDTVYVEMICHEPSQAPHQLSPIVHNRPSLPQINDLAYELGDKWKDLAYNLKPGPFSHSDVVRIKAKSPRDLRGQSQSMLDAWVRKYGSKATIPVLCKALIKAELRHQAERVFTKDVVDKCVSYVT
ncbi:uncharacterized protein [Oscarella lobularis]|uniref:uncharacterized protein isoform X2 n=1 Tax=Oscarella lobularis TaxID=121494 RepID=UPI0033141254